MLPSCSTDGTDVKRDRPLLADAGMKLIEILGINVKLIQVESHSFFRYINEKIFKLNYRQESELKEVTTITYLLHRCTKPNYIPRETSVLSV